MNISFFEEFPTKNNLAKLKLVKRKTRLFVAAKNLSEFRKVERFVQKNHPCLQEVVYWPILNEEEGYWISPWSDPAALERLFSSLHNNPKPVMLDLELPKHRGDIIRRLFSWWRNRRKIRQFLSSYSHKIYLVEMAHLPRWLLRFLGLSYQCPVSHCTPIFMYYTSFERQFLPASIVGGRLRHKARLASQHGAMMGLGLLAGGIYGKEPVYRSEAELQEDLRIVKEERVREIVLFRLGGLTFQKVSILKQFVGKTQAKANI